MKPRFKLPKGEFLILMVLLFFIALIFGGLMNYIVLKENSCKMPVMAYKVYSTDRHFSFQDSSEVRFFALTDRYSFPLSKWVVYFSIGDVIIIFSAISVIFFTILWAKDVKRRKRVWKMDLKKRM